MPVMVRTGSWIDRNSSVPVAVSRRRGVNRTWSAGETQTTLYRAGSRSRQMLYPAHPVPTAPAPGCSRRRQCWHVGGCPPAIEELPLPARHCHHTPRPRPRGGATEVCPPFFSTHSTVKVQNCLLSLLRPSFAGRRGSGVAGSTEQLIGCHLSQQAAGMRGPLPAK